MSKLKLEGKEIASTVKLGKVEIIHFTDGTFIIAEVVSDILTAEEIGLTSEDAAETVKDDDPDPDEITLDDMKDDLLKGKHVTKKKLKALDDDEIEELWDEHFGDDDPDGDGDEDEVTADEINEADYDDLEDIIDEEELDLDIEDYEDNAKDLKKLRKAIAKELRIKL